MKRLLIGIALAGSTLAQTGCATGDAGAAENEVLKERETRFAAALASGDTAGDKPIARWVLPQTLAEISGIALTSDERMLAHGDETAEISEIDYKRGIIVKRFLLGENVLRDDFEGITRVGDRFFLMTSAGKLYEFAEGQNKSQVPYTLHDANLGKECELEGVAYDSTSKALLMPCKVVKAAELKDKLVIFRWSVDSTAKERLSTLAVPLSSVVGSHDWKEFHSSDITVDPVTGNYILISAQEKGLIELTPTGALVSSKQLDDMHNQVEGVAITKGGVLIISDEVGKDKPAAITLYRWRSGKGSEPAAPRN